MSVELEIRKNVVGNVYTATIALNDWSSGDLDLIAAYGDPVVDAGGEFERSPVAFELPTNNVRLRRDFPLTQRFDVSDNEDAEDHRDLWADEMQDRIVAALDALRTNASPTFARTITTV